MSWNTDISRDELRGDPTRTRNVSKSSTVQSSTAAKSGMTLHLTKKTEQHFKTRELYETFRKEREPKIFHRPILESSEIRHDFSSNQKNGKVSDRKWKK
jgi:hypothetical protein